MKSFFFIILGLSVINGMAQKTPDYVVFLIKGHAFIVKNGHRQKPLKQNNLVFKTDVISVGKKTEITLVNRDQQYFDITKPGLVSINKLEKNSMLHKTTGVTHKYLELLWDDMMNPQYDNSKLTVENLTGTFGGVSRSRDKCDNLIYPPQDMTTSKDSLHFCWLQTSAIPKYEFFLFDDQGKQLADLPVTDTALDLDIQKTLNNKSGSYYWKVKGVNGSCEKDSSNRFTLVDRDTEIRLVSELMIKDSSSSLSSGLSSLELLESNHLTDAASDFYQKLITKYPEDRNLRKVYILFLTKYGFDKEAWYHLKAVTETNR